jgi:ABC-2 type transport system ATP-binding protein
MMNTPAQPVIEFQNVSKRFGKTVALNDVSLSLSPGHIVGLLGANGSGKTTLLRHAIGLYLPQEGECNTLGCTSGDLTAELMARVGYVAQEGELLEWLSVRQLIAYVRAYYENWNSELEKRLREEFELTPKARVAGLSPGLRQRLAILLAVCPEPDLLILDEPAAGLDPIARGQFLDLLMEIIQSPDRTIVISSHILGDVEKVIDHALIMHEGKLIRDCSFAELQEEFSRLVITATTDLPNPLPFAQMLSCNVSGRQAEAVVRTVSPDAIQSFETAHHAKVEVQGLGLEDLYRYVVQSEPVQVA